MLNEGETEIPQSAIPEAPANIPPAETAPVVAQPVTEHANVFQKLVAKIQSTFSGKKEAPASVNMQPSAPAAETPQPQTPPTPGIPTT